MSNSVENMKAGERFIILNDGTGMGDSKIVFKTNAPVEELKELERISCQVYIDGKESDEVPIWAKVLEKKGYVFSFVDEHQHVTAFGTSNAWKDEQSIYQEITEEYTIENQLEL